MKTKNYVNEFCNTVKTLHKQYPTQNMGRHLDAAFADYKSLFGVSDKELSYALDKYMQTLEIDPIATDAELDKLMRDTDKIFSSGFSGLDEEDEEEDY
jgi:hypothetical protein